MSGVIVSMTSFPEAIPYAMGAVKSLLRSRVKPDRVVLYLTFSQFGAEGLPPELLRLAEENELFEVRDYPVDIRSYRKLVPALADFPDSVIVTVDDDVHYHPDMLGELLEMHRRYPDAVIAHRAKRIIPGLPYKKWRKYRWYHFLGRKLYDRFDTVQTGVGGVLYPPGVLDMEMIRPELFTRIAPTADDLWFWAAAVAKGHKVIPVPFGRNKPRGLGKPKALSLKLKNFKRGVDRNTAALEGILAEYPNVKDRLYGEK